MQRDLVLAAATTCTWAGCVVPNRYCHADHLDDWHTRHGPTDIANGGPACPHHNLFKNHGYRTHRDHHGYWHTHRPDGTEITDQPDPTRELGPPV